MNYFLLRFFGAALAGILLGASLGVSVTAAAEPTGSSVEASIHQLLDSRDQLESVLFGDVVRAVSGHPVLAVDPADPVDAGMLDSITDALASSLKQFADAEHPIHQIGPVNEISRLVEDTMQEELDAMEGYLCEVPVNASGHRQRSGYPDLRFVHIESGRVFYLDPKVYRKGSETSTFRTFYFEPRAPLLLGRASIQWHNILTIPTASRSIEDVTAPRKKSVASRGVYSTEFRADPHGVGDIRPRSLARG